MNDKGWVALHRKIRNNHFLMHDINAYAVFTKLLLFVNSNGQWSGGRRQLAELMDMNDRTLYQVLQRIEHNHMITISSNRRYSIYSIFKWEDYQPKGNQSKSLLTTTAQPQRNHSATTAQHSNKNKEERIENKKPPSKIDVNETPGAERKNGYGTFSNVGAILKSKKLKGANL